jgi:sugar lactone lactonase YvrE
MHAIPAPDVLFDLAADTGEGPSWVEATGHLSFVDIPAGRVYLGDLAGIGATFEVGVDVGAAMPATDGGFLLARRDGFVRLAPDGTQTPIALPLADDPSVRFNDGKVDPQGRPWAGTMPYGDQLGRGVLYRLDGATPVEAVTGVGQSNGLGWSPDGRTLYFVDTRAACVDAFDVDIANGGIANRRTLVDLAGAEGVPDGLCVDDDGSLWVAMWGGWAVLRFTPGGRELEGIRMPVAQPSSCCFAGDVLVVTTAAHDLSPGQLAAQPHAGAVFAVRPGVSGPGAVPWAG